MGICVGGVLPAFPLSVSGMKLMISEAKLQAVCRISENASFFMSLFLPSHRRQFLSDNYSLSFMSTWQPPCSLSLVHHLSGTPSTPRHRNVGPPPLQASSICTWEIQSRPLSPSRCVHIRISSNCVVGLAVGKKIRSMHPCSMMTAL